MNGQAQGNDRTIRATEGHPGGLRRLWQRIVLAWRWVRMPNAVGRPITLEPNRVRFLLLLVLGNLMVLALLGVALGQATRISTTPSPAQSEIVHVPVTLPSPTPAPTPTPAGRDGAIAFSLKRSGSSDIYALDQRTNLVARLTDHPADDRSPAWSPDGNYVAFASSRAGSWDVYLLDLVSGALIRLTHETSFDGNPSWSPDGEWIAFESYREGNLDIYVMSTNGKQVRPITTHPAADYAPTWTADSEAIVFTSLRDGGKDIYLRALAQDSELTNLTQSPDIDVDAPAWSPDGSRIAYVTGPPNHSSVLVVELNSEILSANPARAELVGLGGAPVWAHGGESLLYAHERGGRSHIVAAGGSHRPIFDEIYTTEGLVIDLAWSDAPLSPRVVARAQPADTNGRLPSYTEVVHATAVQGAPYQLVPLPGVTTRVGSAVLSDRVNDSFNVLRRRVAEDVGWDYLATLDSSLIALSHTPPSGHSRNSWQLCGRAFALDQEPYGRAMPMIELTREDVGNATYWRVFIRAAEQDGSLGEPLREHPWDLNARYTGGRAAVDGGARKQQVPTGYYVDFTALAREYGWERVASSWRWRTFWPDIRWWEYRKTGNSTWWDCMLEVFEPVEVESAFGPIPGR